MSDFEFTNIEEFINSIDNVMKEFPKLSEKHLRKMGNVLKKNAQDATPIGKDNYSNIPDKKEQKKAENKHMKKRWRGKITGVGTKIQYELRNTSPAYHLVERGHVLKSKKGKVLGYVQGKHFFEKTEKEFEASNTIDNEMNKFFNDIDDKIK